MIPQTLRRSILIVLTLVFSFSSSSIKAQSVADSLLAALAKSGNDSNRVILLNSLANAYNNQDKEKAFKYTQDAFQLARKIGYRAGEAKAINSLGILVQKNGNYDSALVLQNQALAIYQELKDTKGIAKVYGDICIPYWRKSDYVTALDYQLKALKLYEQIDEQKGMAYSYNMIGIIYKNMKKDKEALKYYLKSAEAKIKVGDEKTLASTYNNIGNIYKTRMSEDTAMEYYKKALTLHKKFGNKSGESMVVSGMGDLKFKFGKYAEAKKYYLLSMEIEEVALDSNNLATGYINIGNACAGLREFKEADAYIQKGLAIFKKIGDKEGAMSAYEMLAYMAQEEHNYEKAFEYYQYYVEEKDSIMSIKERSEIAELQTRYDVEKKDLELARNQAELETKNKEATIKNIIILAIIGLVGLLAIVGYLFYNKKRVEQQARMDAEIARQKDMRSKAVIDAEEKERRRIAQDLHDGVGQILSAAKLNLSSLESTFDPVNESQKFALKNTLNLIDDSVKEVRAVSHNMMPNTLIKLGLASAVREFITKIGGVPNLKIDLEIVGLDQRLEENMETALYRAIQEIVNNIIKHANASRVGIQLIRHERELSVVVEDNGVGFDVEKVKTSEGIGLKNIFSRIELINGSVHFDSLPGRGTTVLIDVPL